ncbi:MAG: hypothetical protein WBC83_01555 [Minisyncoccia bacterium]
MINIFATKEKKKILNKYRIRLTIVSLIVADILITSNLILFMSPYLLSISKYNNLKKELATLEEVYGGGVKEKDVDSQVIDINNKISVLLKASAKTQLSPYQVISDIINNKSRRIKIYGVTYDSVVNQERVVITGEALERDSLSGFFEELKKDTRFTDVTLPISSYVKSENIEFSVVLERNTKPTSKNKTK